MKYIKTYENHNEPEINDYVILKSNIDTSNEFRHFAATTIAQIFNIFPESNGNTRYLVQYEYVPPELELKFVIRRYANGTKEYFANAKIENIQHFSKDKEDLIIYADATKYNL